MGSLVFQANYASGLRVLEIADGVGGGAVGGSLTEVGYFDTSNAPLTQMVGAWSVYPYFGNGKVIVSGDEGIHVIQLSEKLAHLSQQPAMPQSSPTEQQSTSFLPSASYQSTHSREAIMTVTSSPLAITSFTSDLDVYPEFIQLENLPYISGSESFVTVFLTYSSDGEADGGIKLKVLIKKFGQGANIGLRILPVDRSNGKQVSVTVPLAEKLVKGNDYTLLAYITSGISPTYANRKSSDIIHIEIGSTSTITNPAPTSDSDQPEDRLFTEVPDDVTLNPPSTKSCTELEWHTEASICAASKLNGKCFNGDDVTHEWASRLCALFDSRLCALTELATGVALGTGCLLDQGRVWTSETCFIEGKPGFLVAGGGDGSSPSCAGLTSTSSVRCCADMQAAPIGESETSFSTPGPSTASQLNRSEKSCNDLGLIFKMGLTAPLAPSSEDVCCAVAKAAENECMPSSVTFASANTMCTVDGARLCTIDELEGNECAYVTLAQSLFIRTNG